MHPTVWAWKQWRINSRLPAVVHLDFRGHLCNAGAVVHYKGFHRDDAESGLLAPTHPERCILYSVCLTLNLLHSLQANYDPKNTVVEMGNMARKHKYAAANRVVSNEW